MSPSFWWNNESLLKAAPQLLEKQTGKSVRVFIAVGKEGKIMEGDAKQFSAALQASNQKNLVVDFVSFPAESHLTILHNSVYKGLQALYALKKTTEKTGTP